MGFLVFVTAAVVGINRYLWQRLVRDTRLSPATTRAATLALIGLTASAPLTVISWGLRSRASVPGLTLVAFSWLGLSLYLLGFLALWDAVRAGVWLVRALRARFRPPLAAGSSAQPMAAERVPEPLPPASAPSLLLTAAEPAAQLAQTRRVFIARTAATGAIVAAGGIGVFGVRSALWDITMPEVSIELERFPRALDGYTIALLTDVHIGPLLDGRFLRQLAERINRARPDLIAIAGDLVDGRVAQIGAQVAELQRLRARDGVYFVTGNHEYYSHADEWVDFLQRLGVNVLMNERVSIAPAARPAAVGGRGGPRFDLAGVPDRGAGYAGGVAPDAALATRGRDDQTELVMLAHQPIQIAASTAVGAGLQLSGHTHGGQLFPFGAVTRLGQPYLAGLYRHAPATQIYVSRGTGFWGPPMRVLAPAEVALLRLSSA